MKPKLLSNLAIPSLLLALSTLTAFAQPGQMTQTERELADYIKGHYTKREVLIPMRIRR